MARVEIRQLEELEVFDALKLSVEVLAEVLAEILAELAAEIAAEIAGGIGLKVLLVAVRYWNSLKSYTSFNTQSLIIVGGYL